MMLFRFFKTAAVSAFLFILSSGTLFGNAGLPVVPQVKNPPPMRGKFNAAQWSPALELKLRTRDGKSSDLGWKTAGPATERLKTVDGLYHNRMYAPK